jgi:hypothetical protein
MTAMTDTSRDRSTDSLTARDQSRDGARLELRASDADRDDAAAVLGAAMATGRLTTTLKPQR